MDFSQIVKDTFVPMFIGKILFMACCSLLIILLQGTAILNVLMVAAVLYIIWYIKAQIKPDIYLLFNYIFVIAVILIAINVGQRTIKEVPGLLTFVTVMVVIDVISFSNLRFSKYTLNSVALNNKPILAKLLIFADVKKYHFYLPVFGIGDVYFLSVILTSLYNLNKIYLLYGNFLILCGTALDVALIWLFHRKEKFKGYPATVGMSIFTYAFFIIRSFTNI